MKVRATEANRAEIMRMVELSRGRVVDLADGSVVAEVTGTESEIDTFVSLVRTYGIKELVRTGAVVMARGTGSIEEAIKQHPARRQWTCGGRRIVTAKMYYDNDADPAALAGQTVAIIGYGSQGHAHALNLHESGVDVVVGLAPGSKSRALAADAGLTVMDVADAVKAADVIMILVPGHLPEGRVRRRDRPEPAARAPADVRPRLQHPFRADRPARHRGRGHGRAQGPRPPAPQRLPAGGGVPALFAVHRDQSGTARDRTLAYARAIGSTRAGVLETTFAEETETDLFGEQSVLCGGTAALVKMAFETLVEAGYQPELAYFETMHELKLIVDLMYRGGLNFMRFSVSDTAEYGDYVSGPRIIDEHVRGDDAGRAQGHPGRQLRRALDRRERFRPPGVRAAARGGPRPPDRAGGGEPARPDAVPRPGRGAGRTGAGRGHDPRGVPMSPAVPGPSGAVRARRAASASSTPPCATGSRHPAPA